MVQHVEKQEKAKEDEDKKDVEKCSNQEIQTIMDMLQNIAKDKVHEILGPLIATLLPNSVSEIMLNSILLIMFFYCILESGKCHRLIETISHSTNSFQSNICNR